MSKPGAKAAKKLSGPQIATLAALAKVSGPETAFAYGSYGRSGHSLANSGLLDRANKPSGRWQWGFRINHAGLAALERSLQTP